MKVPCKNIPYYNINKKEWSTKSFEDQYEFAEFLEKNCFKEIGEYKFHKSFSNDLWQEKGNAFDKNGRYIDFAENTTEWKDFWDNEKLKCRLGVLWEIDGRWYYTTRDYYFLINYFRLENKEDNYRESFPTVRDGQYHMMLYEKIAEMYDMNSGVVKRRQFMYSNCHVGKSINYLWFENNKRIKWTASDESKIVGPESSWHMLNIAKKHLNLHTGWHRLFSPDGQGEIVQRVKIKKPDGDWYFKGNESMIVTSTTKKDPSAPVGGPTYWLWYEEGGIAPTADLTFRYMEPAIQSGGIRTGSMTIGGSVGDLNQCKPLKDMILEPNQYGIYSVPTKFYDETGIIKMCGLFIPAQCGMPEATDEHGNSLVDLALHILEKSEKEGWKVGEMKGNVLVRKDEEAWINMKEEQYILKKSQNPRTLKEAFAYRDIPTFNVPYIERRQEQLKRLYGTDAFYRKQGLLERDKNGKPYLKQLHEFLEIHRPTELEYPINEKSFDKRGVVNIYEEYNPKCSYYAGVDSTEVEITNTSKSVFSMTVYRRSYTEEDITTGKTRTVPGKIVATWAGRFNSSEETFDHGMMLLEMYKAKAACERNKPGFINHCRRNGKSLLIARRNELPFDKDIDVTASENDQFGVWRDSAGKLLKELIGKAKEYLSSETSVEYLDKPDSEDIGKIKVVRRGYDIIDDYWLAEELKLYNRDDNFDRVDSFLYAIAFGVAEELSFRKVVTVQSNEIKKKPVQIQKSEINLLSYGRTANRSRNMLKY